MIFSVEAQDNLHSARKVCLDEGNELGCWEASGLAMEPLSEQGQ